jgi:hypothetical protein
MTGPLKNNNINNNKKKKKKKKKKKLRSTTTTHGSENLSTELMQVAPFSIAAVRQFHKPVCHNY